MSFITYESGPKQVKGQFGYRKAICRSSVWHYTFACCCWILMSQCATRIHEPPTLRWMLVRRDTAKRSKLYHVWPAFSARWEAQESCLIKIHHQHGFNQHCLKVLRILSNTIWLFFNSGLRLESSLPSYLPLDGRALGPRSPKGYLPSVIAFQHLSMEWSRQSGCVSY